MKAFWWSLLGFCLLMCGCVSKDVKKSAVVSEQISTELDYIKESVKVDTFSVSVYDKSREYRFIKETITIKEYDKDTGALTQETKTEREFTQNLETDIEQKEQGRVIESVNDSTKVTENVKTETEMNEDSVIESGAVSFWSKFGKWIGIVIGCGIGFLLLYLFRKHRVN